MGIQTSTFVSILLQFLICTETHKNEKNNNIKNNNKIEETSGQLR